MSTDVPRFSRFRLLNALYAGVMAGVMAGPMFISQFQAVFDEIIMALGMIWAVRCSSLSFPVTCSTSWEVLIACLIGAAIIAVVMPLTTVICSGTFNLYVCAVVTLPFCFAVSMAAPCNKCKLVQLYDYKTTLTVVYLGLFFCEGRFAAPSGIGARRQCMVYSCPSLVDGHVKGATSSAEERPASYACF
ncbi:hypothetical protein FOZ60_004366 [Perkinsus olseni]|uniref:Transmembrane protein n=1 Tax=Perkinsus olseni TaxID=32597 RepID=A0A7J6NVF8_PEROL|nr:hypothetical protein FOZ60_004366 [Perkinsus olseni]